MKWWWFFMILTLLLNNPVNYLFLNNGHFYKNYLAIVDVFTYTTRAFMLTLNICANLIWSITNIAKLIIERKSRSKLFFIFSWKKNQSQKGLCKLLLKIRFVLNSKYLIVNVIPNRSFLNVIINLKKKKSLFLRYYLRFYQKKLTPGKCFSGRDLQNSLANIGPTSYHAVITSDKPIPCANHINTRAQYMIDLDVRINLHKVTCDDCSCHYLRENQP